MSEKKQVAKDTHITYIYTHREREKEVGEEKRGGRRGEKRKKEGRKEKEAGRGREEEKSGDGRGDVGYLNVKNKKYIVYVYRYMQ